MPCLSETCNTGINTGVYVIIVLPASLDCVSLALPRKGTQVYQRYVGDLQASNHLQTSVLLDILPAISF